MNIRKLLSVLASSVSLTVLQVNAQSYVNYTGGTYTQTFDALPYTPGTAVISADPVTLHGVVCTFNNANNAVIDFAAPVDGSGATSGSTGGLGQASLSGWYGSSATSYKFGAHEGSDTKGATISFGGLSSGNRALGLLSANGSGITTFGVKIINKTTNSLTAINLSFVGELWRQQTTAKTIDFGFTVASGASTMPLTQPTLSAITFATGTASPVDGTAAINQTNINLTAVALSPAWTNGEALWITWQTASSAGNAQGIGIDNFVFSAGASCSITISNQPANQSTCTNGAAMFSVTAAGNGLGYQWQISTDGVNYNNLSGATLSAYTTNHPVASANGDKFRCLLTGTCSAATSSVATLTIAASTTPAVSVTASPGTNLCAGTPAVFTATPVNGGLAPAYQWYLNNVAAGTKAGFTNSSPANGDQVYVVLTSSDPCAAVPTATSMTNTLTVKSTPLATITAAGSVPANSTGNSATVPNAGAGAVYSWTIGNGAITGGSGTTGITYAAGANGNVTLGCTVTNSAGCFSSPGSAVVAINPVINQTLRQVQRVFVIALENHNFRQPSSIGSPQQILSNTAAPYLNSLLTPGNSNAMQVAYAVNYFNAGIGVHGSEPNYIWSEAGTDFGVHTDADPAPANGNIFSNNHLTRQLNAAGIAWKNYQEDAQYSASPLISTSGTTSLLNPYNGTGNIAYAVKHNPMAFFSDTATQNVYTLAAFVGDLTNNTVGRYNWITPDLYNEMHSPLPAGFTYHGIAYTGDQAAVAAGDSFLSILIPKIMASPAYANNGLIILWWDETEGGDTTTITIPEVVISPLARGNAYASTMVYSHTSDLKTMEEIFGLAYLTNTIPAAETTVIGTGYNDVTNVNDLGDLFLSAPVLAVSPASLNFGSLAVGQSSTQNFAVINLGQLPLTGTVSVAGPFVITAGSSYNLSGGHTGTVSLSFSPVSAGAFTNNVLFASNGGNPTNLVTGLGGMAPVSLFNASPTNGAVPLPVTFTDLSTGMITNRAWDFGDGTTTNTVLTSLTHTYNVTGAKTVTLIVSGPFGAGTNSAANLIGVHPVDSVGDGIADAWRAQYFGGSGTATNAQSCAVCDVDGTGQNNLIKYLAGLNPTNPASKLQITAAVKQGNDLFITWSTAGMRTNVVQAASSLTGVFSNISPNIILPIPGDTTTNFLDQGGATNKPTRFYKINLVP